MIFKEKQKSQPISKRQVWDAFKAVKCNDGSAGVDNIDIVEIERHPGKCLYPLWNRMASGSYMPLPVREVLINKKDGRKRAPGIPTVLDRVAQEVIRQELEKIAEPHFVPTRSGFDPKRASTWRWHNARRIAKSTIGQSTLTSKASSTALTIGYSSGQ